MNKTCLTTDIDRGYWKLLYTVNGLDKMQILRKPENENVGKCVSGSSQSIH